RPDVTVLVDEALVDLGGERLSAVPLVEELPNLLAFRSFSKAWALAGLRAGYVIGPTGDEELLALLSPGQGVSSPAQAAIAAALEDPVRASKRLGARRREIAAEAGHLAVLLRGTPFAFDPSVTHMIW